MKRYVKASLVAVTLLVIGVGQAQATVLFDFETGVQGWYRFGNPTLDFGPTTEGSVGNGLSYVAGFTDPTWWGGAVKSPDLPTVGIDMSQYSGFSADVQLSVDALDPVYTGTPPNVELMFQLPGYLEWAKVVSLPMDGNYYTISSSFADLVPQSSATAPITMAQLQDPSLEIRVVLRNQQAYVGGSTGKLRMRVDQVQGIPEPASIALLSLGGLALLRKRR